MKNIDKESFQILLKDKNNLQKILLSDFLLAWQRNKGDMTWLLPHIDEIYSQFDMKKIEQTLNGRIHSQALPRRRRRYIRRDAAVIHNREMTRLRVSARRFAQILSKRTQYGKEINSLIIQMAKQELKNEAICEVYPLCGG